MTKINMNNIKNQVNLFLYSIDGIGFKELKFSNLLIKKIEEATNEAIEKIYN